MVVIHRNVNSVLDLCFVLSCLLYSWVPTAEDEERGVVSAADEPLEVTNEKTVSAK